ncbi:MAG TPA: CehA/McbA family metallohydrolase [Victivallales bacterium]|nr:CehA/McbA family metallohydrolase [Victivallales bacterium]HRR06442.1 CehA/McbA family metallohydrolase [Victivallales bacterium]HRU01155.1 CehA/McbA family metallohydrolase [Victivallales bacterium]
MKKYFKGNFHCHSCWSDGEAKPENVVKFYKFVGYDFVGISDHNILTELKNQKNLDICEIPCSEYTGENYCHILAIGVSKAVKPESNSQKSDKLSILQDGINKSIEAGGIPVIAHPFWYWTLDADIIKKTKNCYHFEICNASPDCNSFPLPGFEPGDELWDQLLSSGRKFYGLASDDAHNYYTPYNPRAPFAGKAFNGIFSTKLSPKNILNSLKKGDFFASTGIELKNYNVSKNYVEIEVKQIGREKTVIEFIGNEGKKLMTKTALKGKYFFKGNEKYVRIRIASTAGLWLWTQPIFLH